jgi:hypothetical protein
MTNPFPSHRLHGRPRSRSTRSLVILLTVLILAWEHQIAETAVDDKLIDESDRFAESNHGALARRARSPAHDSHS